MKYKVIARLSLSSVLPPIADLVKSMNASLKSFGVPDKIDITSEMIEGTLTVNRELTREEIEKVKNIIADSIRETMPGTWKVSVERSTASQSVD